MKKITKDDTLGGMDVNFPKLEERILEYWKKQKAFEKSVARRRPPASAKATAGKRFVFYDGPSTANAPPGFHHVFNRVFKDVVLRYKTMRGFFVPRKAGWDTHGLPVELQMEKKLGLNSKKDIEQYGIAKFNEECRKSAWGYIGVWEKFYERVGFWINMKDPYITYETSYIETLWFIIKQFWGRKLLYKDYKVVPYCARCGTPLSSHELAQGYKTVEDQSVYVRFKLKPGQKIGNWATDDSTYILSWTTTPWTLPGNVALAVGENIKYVRVQSKGASKTYILAKDLVGAVFKDFDGVESSPFSGKDLVGLLYQQLFPIASLRNAKSHRIYAADFVTTTDGTGVVHTAVMYGEDDYQLGKKVGLPQHHTVDEQGKFTNGVPGGLGGLFVKAKETEEKLFNYLKANNNLLAIQPYSHEYPFCWRCSTPLLYFAKDSWFVNMQKVKQELIANNKKINWVPSHLKEGRMGEWLREVKDWAFSRERYWGTPLPIWECKKCSHTEVIGTIQELKERAHALPHNEKEEIDLHRPYIDEITFPCRECKTGIMQRVKEVADVWFDSGAMPFAQGHWPFAGNPKSKISNPKPPILFPADYIVEAIDQTRGWFYTLLAVATLLGFKSPYKNVICLSHVLDEKGEKMSKSKGNVVDPWVMIRKYGIDAVRWYFFTMNNPGDPKLFSEKDIQEVLRKFILTLWNCFMFHDTYSRPKPSRPKPGLGRRPKPGLGRNVLDRWIHSRLSQTRQEVTQKLDAYDVTGAGRSLESFVVNDLSLWYIRRSRSRFQNPSSAREFQEALATLSFVLLQTSKLAAPFIPFLSEYIHTALRIKGSPSTSFRTSVHWEDWPLDFARGKPTIDKKLEKEMAILRDLVTKALAERAKAGIKVRQALALLKIRNPKHEIRNELLKLITEEINVKKIVFDKNLKNEVELDTKITPQLKEEGMLREVIRAIQEMRKEAGYKPGEKAVLYYKGKGELANILKAHQDLIAKGSSIKKFAERRAPNLDKEKQVSMESFSLWMGITKRKQV